jgi:hypothetical protein
MAEKVIATLNMYHEGVFRLHRKRPVGSREREKREKKKDDEEDWDGSMEVSHVTLRPCMRWNLP